MNSLNLYIGQLQGRLCTNVVRESEREVTSRRDDDELLRGVLRPETEQDQASPHLLCAAADHHDTSWISPGT